MFKKSRRAESKSEKSGKSIKKRTREMDQCRAGSSRARPNITTRKCKITQNTRKSRKSENTSSSSTMQRITFPPKLFSKDVKLETVIGKNTKGATLEQHTCDFLNEDLNAASESSRWPKRNPRRFDENYSTPTSVAKAHYTSVADYYMKLESQRELNPPRNQTKHNPNKNSSNSLFKQINCSYKYVLAKQKVSTTPESTEKTTLNIDRNWSIPLNNFCKKLEKQLPTVTANSRKIRSIQKITTMVTEIDAVLEGHGINCPLKEKIQSNTNSNRREEIILAPISQLIPKSRWLYKTPSNQKVKRPVIKSYSSKLNSCILQKNYKDNEIVLITKSTYSNGFVEQSDTGTWSPSSRITYDEDDNYPLHSSFLVEKFKPSHWQASKRSATSLLQSRPMHSSIPLLLSTDAIPPFEDIGKTTRKILMPTKKEDPPFPCRPTKIARRTMREDVGIPKFLCFDQITNHQLFSLKHLVETESGEESEKFDKDPNILAQRRGEYFVRSNRKQAQSTFTREIYIRPPASLGSSNKENHRPRDFSNHPESSESQINHTFIMNEQFLLPPMPVLDVSS